MKRPIVAIRGEPGLSQTVALARKTGLEVTGLPLFAVHPLVWSVPTNTDFDGLLIGSANAIRHGGAPLERCQHLPVYAVGTQTAKAAERAGFTVAHVGTGGLQSVLDHRLAQSKRFLRLAGSERVPLEPHSGQEIAEICVYDNAPVPAPAELADMVAESAIILLHSAAAMLHFTNECNRMGIDRSRIILAALGPRIVHNAGAGWAAIHIASEPTDAALLALTNNICQ